MIWPKPDSECKVWVKGRQLPFFTVFQVYPQEMKIDFTEPFFLTLMVHCRFKLFVLFAKSWSRPRNKFNLQISRTIGF